MHFCLQVPGTEGRAGMAAILDHDETLNLEQLYDGMAKSLASYARPLFIRTVKQMEMTGMLISVIDFVPQGNFF